MFHDNPTIPKYQRLLKIGLTVLRHRKMSSQEAAYRLSNLKFIHTSRRFIYLNTRMPNKRFKILKSRTDIESLSNDSTDIFLSNLIDYYHYRPSDLEQMCLYRFCS